MITNKNKGFTLIELLVVIAIIGILASVVLASLNTARGKAANAAVKAQLSSTRTEMELYYDSHSQNYTGACISPKIDSLLDSASLQGTGFVDQQVCNDTTGVWAAGVLLRVAEGGNTAWCVDSTGTSKAIADPLGGGEFECPAS